MRVNWPVKCQCQTIGAISLVFDNQLIHCQYLQEIEIYLDDQYSESVSNKNLALHWQQNSCPGIALTFLVFSCCHLKSDHLFTFNFAIMFYQYSTSTFPPLKNNTQHLLIM